VSYEAWCDSFAMAWLTIGLLHAGEFYTGR
jgi:hypothetical protein